MALTRPRFYQSDTTVARIQDPITVLNTNSTAANIDVGFIINRNLGVNSNVALYWNETGDEITLGFTANTGASDGNIILTSYANLRAGTIYGNIGGGNSQANVYITGSLIPTANVAYDLGTDGHRFRDLWLSGTTLHMGDQRLTVTNGQWRLTTPGSDVILGSQSTIANLTVTGTLTLQGPTTTFDSNNLVLQDSIIELHTQANLAPLTGDDGRDIGLKFHYYKTQDEHAFLGFRNSTGFLEWYDSGREGVGNVFTGNTFGTIKSGGLILSNTTSSISTTTGALRVAGGIGIAGNIYVGTDLVVGTTNIVSNLSTVATNITTLFSSAATQDSNLGTATTNISNLQANVGAYEMYANANLGTATTNISNLQASVSAYESWANVRIQSIDANLGTATTNITALSSNSATQQTQIDSIVSGANANSFAYLTTTGATVPAATTAFKTQVQSNITAGTAYVSFVNAVSGNVDQNVNTGLTYNPNSGNLTAYGLITTTGLFWANGTAFSSGSSYGNTQVAEYLPTYSGTIGGTVTGSSQPNITDLGTLINLDVSGATYLTGFVTMDGTGGGTPQYSVKIGNADGEKLAFATRGTAGYGVGLETLTDNESGYGKLTVTASELHFDIKNSVAATVLTNAIVVQANGIVTLDGNTESSSTTTGALIVRGGVAIGGNVYAGKIYTTDGLYWSSNGTQYVGNDEVLKANIGAYQIYANATAATQATSINSIDANVGAYQTYANANAATQATSINSIDANVGAYQTWANTSIVSLYTNANANTAAYLTTYTGNIQAGNISVTGNVNVTSNVFANKLYTTNGLYWAGNSVAFSSGGGGGAGLTYTAGVAPPVSGNISGDQWYYTSTDVLYEYVNDGTTSYWVDIQSQTIAATTTPPVDTTDTLHPFLLAGM
jgi:hypothetical protein